ncbi:MAG: hypothetical protein ACM319_08345 [Deltaproteobacteria bacterium]|nr:hypothetical protein [Candidatus Deferrimicrobiaceae bacterium]
MKRILAWFAAAAFALSLAGTAVAAEPKKADAPPAKAAEAVKKAEPAKKDAVKKAKTKVVTGTIETVDAATGTLSIKGKKETLQLKAGEKVKLDGFKVGDKVTAAYSEGVVSKIVAARKATPMEETNKAGAEKKVAPAAPPAGKK